VLRIETKAAPRSLDPSEALGDPAMELERARLSGLLFETLVTLDARGEAKPCLATAWTHDLARRRWVFSARPNVVLHNGQPWQPTPRSLEFPDEQPIEEILRTLAKRQNAIVIHDGTTAVGTGPFKVLTWDAGKTAVLAAHDGYWGGRPYLDEARILMNRGYAEQATAFEAGLADAIEIPIHEVRRQAARGGRSTVSELNWILALIPEKTIAAPIREALSHAIDRTAVHSVLLQKQGEPTGALLPQMVSGYAFLFGADRNLAAARQAVGSTSPMTLSYDRRDPLLKPIAERILLNTAEAGISLRMATADAGADLRLAWLPISSRDPRTALEDLGNLLRLPLEGASLYGIERALIERRSLIPLFHLPVAHRLSSAVRGWTSREWPLADVWIQQ